MRKSKTREKQPEKYAHTSFEGCLHIFFPHFPTRFPRHHPPTFPPTPAIYFHFFTAHRGREGGNVTARLVAQFSFSPAPSNSFLAALSRLSPSRSRSAREIWSSMTCCTRKPWQFYSSLSARICNNVHAKLSKFPQNIKNHKASEKLKEKR